MATPKPRRSSTDCRSAEGLLVGIVDGILTLAHLYAVRDRGDDYTPAVQEALADLRQDADLIRLLDTPPLMQERWAILSKPHPSPEDVARLEAIAPLIGTWPRMSAEDTEAQRTVREIGRTLSVARWISVEDKLPEHGQRVLFLTCGTTEYQLLAGRYSTATFRGEPVPSRFIESAAGHAFHAHSTVLSADLNPPASVTHWQAAPELPTHPHAS